MRPGAREESASPAWLAAPAMNARDTTKVYKWRLDTGCGPTLYRKCHSHNTPRKRHNNTWVEPLAGNCTTSSTRQREQVWQKCKIQKIWCTVTVAPTIEHHGGHSWTPANQRWDQVSGRCLSSTDAMLLWNKHQSTRALHILKINENATLAFSLSFQHELDNRNFVLIRRLYFISSIKRLFCVLIYCKYALF